MSALIHLIYTSRAVSRFTASELEALTQNAKARNQSLDITGVLLYGGGRFLQLLEGKPQDIETLYYGKIAKDPRHTDCRVLMNEPSAVRLLPDWSMGRLFLQDTEGCAQTSWDALCAEIARQNPAAVFARNPAVACINQFIRHFGSHAEQASHCLDPGQAGEVARLKPC